MFCRDADLFTQQKRASPRDGLITQSTRKAVTAGALFCFVEKPTGGGNRHLEGLTMNDDRMTVVPDFLGELDAGVFMNKIAAALNTVGLGVLNNGNKGKVVLTFDLSAWEIQSKRSASKLNTSCSTALRRRAVKRQKRTQQKPQCGLTRAESSPYCRKIRVNCSVLKALLTESLKRLSEPQLTNSLPPLRSLVNKEFLCLS